MGFTENLVWLALDGLELETGVKIGRKGTLLVNF